MQGGDYNESPEVEEGQDKYKDNSKYVIQILGWGQPIYFLEGKFKPRFFVNIRRMGKNSDWYILGPFEE